MRNNMHFGGEKNDNLDSNSMGFHTIKNTLMNGDSRTGYVREFVIYCCAIRF